MPPSDWTMPQSFEATRSLCEPLPVQSATVAGGLPKHTARAGSSTFPCSRKKAHRESCPLRKRSSNDGRTTGRELSATPGSPIATSLSGSSPRLPENSASNGTHRLARRQDHHHLPPLRFGRLFDFCDGLHVLLNASEQLHAEIHVCHFPPAEAQSDLDLVAFVEEPSH